MILVTPRKNGAKGWRAAWKQPGPDGSMRQMFRHIGDVSRAEAMMQCGEIQRELDAAPLIEPDSIESWSHRFFTMCGKLSPDTKLLYELTFLRLLTHFGKQKRIDQVTDADVRSFRLFLETIRKKNGNAFSSSYINARFRDAHRIWAIAIEAKLTTTNPFASRAARETRASHRVGVAFSRYVPLSELALLLKACPNESWRLIFNLARLGGLRRNEIERADWSLIDLQARRMTVEGGEDDGAARDSTKKHRRVVPIKPELYDVLANQPSRTGLLVRGVNPNNFERDARGIVERSGVEDYGKPLHSLRASFANDMMDQHPIQDVAEWLGHSVEVAMRHYRQRERGSRIEEAARIPLSATKRTPDAHNLAGANQ
jgi:integrase